MLDLNIQLLSILQLAVFLTAVLMHVVRRNSRLIWVYAAQSCAVVAMLLTLGLSHSSISLISVALITFLVKVTAAPKFFSKFIDHKQLKISTNTYLNLPVTLAIILGLTILVKSSIFAPIIALFPQDSQLMAFALSGILISMFLVINRKGVFSQLIGILSFENGLVAFSTLAGLEQTLAIEIGILFNMLLWILISSIMVTFVYVHFGSLDASRMSRLKD